jgi:uncharacterized protein
MDQPPILPPHENQPPTPPPGAPRSRQWIVGLHLLGLVGILAPVAGNILAPLILWLVKKPDMPELEAPGRDVLNFQISWSIWMIAAGLLGAAGSCLLFPLLLPVGVFLAWLILTVIGSVKASNGEAYKYPLTISMFG